MALTLDNHPFQPHIAQCGIAGSAKQAHIALAAVVYRQAADGVTQAVEAAGKGRACAANRCEAAEATGIHIAAQGIFAG